MTHAITGTATEKIKILLVDDTIANLKALEALLDSPDRTILTASSGGDALRILMHQDVAAILLDVRMDDMDGYETARLIRSSAKFHDVPIIFMTASPHTMTDVEQGYALGAVDYISKPIAPTIIKAKVNAFVALAKRTALMPTTVTHHLTTDPRVLIVDDDEALLEILPTILQTRIPALHIDLCLTVKEALGRLASSSYGTIILDIRMPGQSGLSLLHEAHRLQPGTPVLLMTGEIGNHAAEAYNAGAFDCLQKPFDGATVAMAVKRALERYVVQRQRDDLEALLNEVTPGMIELEQIALVLSHESEDPADLPSPRMEKIKSLIQQTVLLSQSQIRALRGTLGGAPRQR